MYVQDIMTHNPISIDKTASLADALILMESHEFHHLPVKGQDDILVGIITDGDIYRVLGRMRPSDGGLDWRTDIYATVTQVRKAMTAAPFVAEPHMPILVAAGLFQKHHICSLPVIKGETLVGIITTFDLLMALIRVLKHETSTS
jgi:acetoin utilization protein AcuB